MTRLERALQLLRDLNHTRLTGDRYQEKLVDFALTELDDEVGYKRGLHRLFDNRCGSARALRQQRR